MQAELPEAAAAAICAVNMFLPWGSPGFVPLPQALALSVAGRWADLVLLNLLLHGSGTA